MGTQQTIHPIDMQIACRKETRCQIWIKSHVIELTVLSEGKNGAHNFSYKNINGLTHM